MVEPYKIDVPEGKSGGWVIERFIVDARAAALENLRASIGSSARPIEAGTYTALRRNGHTVMSDTPAEYRDMAGVVRAARGRVLLIGLGLGCLLDAVARKPEVTHIDVIEQSPDVISLVWPHWLSRYGSDRVALIEADARAYQPRRGERWDVAWLDIWDNICGDNAKEMTALRARYRRRAAWVGAWCYYETLRAARYGR